MSPRRPRALRLLALLSFALLPTVGVAVRALADDASDDPASEAQEPTPQAPTFPQVKKSRAGKGHDGHDNDGREGDGARARARVLESMPQTPTVLINVTARELPASPDILLLGRRGVAALARCLADNTDAGLRVVCASFLGRIGDKQALPALQTALDDWEPPVREAVIEALGRIPDASSIDPLIKLYGKGEHTIPILHALGAIGHRKFIAFLRKALFEPKEGDAAAFEALWRCRHGMSRDTLVGDVGKALGLNNDPLVLSATRAAAELRSTALVSHLVGLLEHNNPTIRNKAVYALGVIGDKAATKALLAKLPSVRDGRMLNNIAFALERLDREAFYQSIHQLIEHKQAVIRLNSAFVLGDVGRPEGLPMLEKTLGDPSDLVKTTTVVAMGKIADAKEVPRLEPLVDSANLSLKEESIYAIFAMAGKAKADLVYDKLFESKHESLHRRAALALGALGDPRVRDYLLACVDRMGARRRTSTASFTREGSPRIGGRLLLSWVTGRPGLDPSS